MHTRRDRIRSLRASALAALALMITLPPSLGAAQTEGGEQAGAAPEATPQALAAIETVRARVLAPLLESAPDATLRKLVGALRPDGSWPDVDYRDPRRSSWTTSRHLGNLATLARAYRAADSTLCGDPELRTAVLAGLDYWLEHDFQNSNWWWNQIGVPRSLAPTLLLMEDELTDLQRERGLKILRRAKIGMTGQNLVWVTEITALRGILEKDPALVAAAYRRIGEEIRRGTGEGIQADFSFHQHGPCLYNHGYGAAFTSDCSRIATQVADTPWAFPPEKIALLAGLILDGSQWMTRGSASDFAAEGREITRRGQSAGYLAVAAGHMLKLPTGREPEFEALAARASGRPAVAFEGNRHFWRSDLMTHHREGYFTSARMFSSRIANTDNPCNSEGLKSHHIADGCNPIMRTGREYDEIFPVWDWQKIPGTTVEQTPGLTGSPRRQGSRSFAGGVSDGTYGLAALDFARDGLIARKSWFFFDDQYVCLGSDITCTSKHTVLTTLNQCRLEGSVLVAEGNQTREVERGSHAPKSPAWVWHDRTAYVFLEPGTVQLRNDLQRGSWSAINRQYRDEEIAQAVFCLSINHGSGPENARYAYALVPGVDAAAAGECAAGLPVKILRNDPELQAVRHRELGIAGMAFYESGRLEVRPGLTLGVDLPCLVLLRELPGKIELSVSNPENKAATVQVDLSGKLLGEGVETVGDPPRSRVYLDLPEGMNAGKSVTRTFLRL